LNNSEPQNEYLQNNQDTSNQNSVMSNFQDQSVQENHNDIEKNYNDILNSGVDENEDLFDYLQRIESTLKNSQSKEIPPNT